MSCLIVECTWDTMTKGDFQILIILLVTRLVRIRFYTIAHLAQRHFKGTLTPYIDAVIISHFHLDHCGALPYMSEQVGYEGPIYMTLPTKVIAPILLEDFRKVRSNDFNRNQAYF